MMKIRADHQKVYTERFDHDSFVADVIADLMHYSEVYGVDFYRAIQIAEFNFKVESTENV